MESETNPLTIYVVNVGEGDSIAVKTPGGQLIVVDAMRPKKIGALLEALEAATPAPPRIHSLIITHPHADHYGGAEYLVRRFAIGNVILAPFWHLAGTPGYHALINAVEAKGIPIRFLSGFERILLDNASPKSAAGHPWLDLLGPSHPTLAELRRNGRLNPNHLSIMARVSYRKFCMVLAGDAQMENWAHFDSCEMLKACGVLKAAHHGSKNGTQWERLDRLAPRLVVVSADPDGRHGLPDLLGAAAFSEYEDLYPQRKVLMTREAGTVKIVVDEPSKGKFRWEAFGDAATADVPLRRLGGRKNAAATSWRTLMLRRAGVPPPEPSPIFPAMKLQRDEYGRLATLPLPNGIELIMRWIPPGNFLMGSPDGEPGRYPDEDPQHRVTISHGFWLGETPVTQAQYMAVMGNNPANFQNAGLQAPVEQVSWDGSQEFIDRLNTEYRILNNGAVADWGFRLPSEADWEYACRAGTVSAFNDGSACTAPDGKDAALERLGWYDKNSGNSTHPVGEKEPNAWGLYDMHGNVWEWCSSLYEPYPYREDDGREDMTSGSYRVLRGGSWYNNPVICRCAYRNYNHPGRRISDLGFRCCCSLRA